MAELFDAYRDTYRATVEGSIGFSGLKHGFFLQAKADLLARLAATRGLGAPAELDVLDIGCGVGALHPYLRPLLPKLKGCDISAESVARARQDNPWADYMHYAPMRLPFADASFDLAFAVCVLHHVPPGDWPDFFAEMKRVLRPGGLACVIEHNPLNPLTRLAVLRCPFDEDAVLLGARKTGALMRNAGFSAVRHDYFLLAPSARPLVRGMERAFSRLPLGAQYACHALA